MAEEGRDKDGGDLERAQANEDKKEEEEEKVEDLE